MIKVASTGYVTITNFTHYGNIAIPTGKVEGERAEFLLVYSPHTERYVWLTRNEII
jgi:hypothetical protein